MNEIKIVYSNHKMNGVNYSETRCYPETFVKELTNGARSGYRKATVTIGQNEHQLILEEAGDFRQWLPETMHEDLVTATKVNY